MENPTDQPTPRPGVTRQPRPTTEIDQAMFHAAKIRAEVFVTMPGGGEVVAYLKAWRPRASSGRASGGRHNNKARVTFYNGRECTVPAASVRLRPPTPHTAPTN